MILIGCDPEVFIKNSKTGQFVSAAGCFPGTKAKPHPVEAGAIQVDGVALEFNINAAKNSEEFVKNIRTVWRQMEELVTKVDKDWVIETIPVAEFDKETWKNVSDQAKELGCDPDYNYNGDVNPSPTEKLQNLSLRTGSGHIHIGWTDGEDPLDPLHFEDCKMVARQFHNSHLFYPASTPDKIRMQYYGMAGSFRPKPYGIELRSPSNSWLKSTQKIKATYERTLECFHVITNGVFR